ncbi:MAG: calcium-binding protein [Litoreibacter sp.]
MVDATTANFTTGYNLYGFGRSIFGNLQLSISANSFENGANALKDMFITPDQVVDSFTGKNVYNDVLNISNYLAHLKNTGVYDMAPHQFDAYAEVAMREALQNGMNSWWPGENDAARTLAEAFGWDPTNLLPDGLENQLEEKWREINEKFDNPTITPLVLDLDGDGIELTSVDEATVHFDLDVNGFAEATGWVSGGDGLLVLDLNGNGVIDNGTELFGDQTGYDNGFLSLASYDETGDGVIDQSDSVFETLLVWRDLNFDGISQDEELIGLNAVGIASINVQATASNYQIAGNDVLWESSFEWIDGSSGAIVDAYFQVDPINSVAIVSDDFTFHDDAFKLPFLNGVGSLQSTWVALSLNDELRQEAVGLVQLIATGDIIGFRTAFESFLFAWADVEGVMDGSRGPVVNAQYLAFLESVLGKSFLQDSTHYLSNPGPVAGTEINNDATSIIEGMAGSFLTQAVVSNALLNAEDDAHHDQLVASHPLFALANFSNTDFHWVGELFGGIVWNSPTGFNLANAETALSLVIHQIEDTQSFSLAITDGYILAGGSAADAEAFAERILQERGVTLTDTAGDDTLQGGSYDDVLHGTVGNDTYIWGSGQGNDVIDEEGNSSDVDRLILTNLNQDDIRLLRFSDADGGVGFAHDLVLEVVATGERLFLDDMSGGTVGTTGDFEGIEEIEFADGSVLTAVEFERLITADIVGTDLDDVLTAVAFDTRTPNVLVDGGAGDDHLTGNSSATNYLYELGDGSDTIVDSGGYDSITFTGVLLSELGLRPGSSEAILVDLPDGATITIEKQLGSPVDRIETFIFEDGSVVDVMAAYLHSQKASGFVQGTQNGDYYVHTEGDGSYTIMDGTSAFSTDDDLFGFTDLNADEVSFTQNAGGDLVMTTAGGDVITVTDHFVDNDLDIERIRFADGTEFSSSGIRGLILRDLETEGDDVLIGDDGDNVINGRAGNDRIDGGNGDDDHYGGDGDDYILGNVGDDFFDGGAGTDTIDFSYSSNHFSLDLSQSNAIFASGFVEQVLNFENIIGGSGNNMLTGSVLDNVIDGGDGNDTLYGLAGDDRIDGGNGDDDHYGGDGDDYILGNVGDDLFDGGNGTDTIDFSYSSDHFNLDLSQSNAIFANGFIEQVLNFENIIGGSGNNVLTGSASDNVIDGGTGNDYLYGGDGNDYIFGNIGADFYDGGDGNDTIDHSYNSSDFSINLSLSQTVFTSGFVEQVLNFENVVGGSGNNTLTGSAFDNVIDGGDGNDILTGGGGADQFLFSSSFDNDVVTDFTDGTDLLLVDIDGIGFDDLTISQNGNDAELNISGHGTIKLTDTDNALVTLDDFIFL